MTLRDSNPVLNHGAVGNGRLIALVAPTGAVEWLCLPRFDSPSVFGRLLDAEKGGVFRFLWRGEEVAGTQQYVANTNVLRTHFARDDEEWEIVDFAPRLPEGLGFRLPVEFIRVVRPLRGHPRLAVDFDPRPGYAAAPVGIEEATDGLAVTGADVPLRLFSNLPVGYIRHRSDFLLDQPLYFVLRGGLECQPPTAASVNHDLELTVAGWRQWAKTCALPNFAPEAVLRSALCLKLHVNEDTGAIIAAATTSIPEAMGTPRTWDYRYCWLRDAAFVVEALRRLSHLQEGEKFIHFLRDVTVSGPLQPLYGVAGEREIPERMLDHLAGFGGNGFVRVGNAAAEQKQNDLNGEIILCLETLLSDPRIVIEEPIKFFPMIEALVEEAMRIAPQPDTGIWEFRSMLRPYTFSRAMCWAAMARGAELARRFRRPDLASRWGARAETEREIILQRGFQPELGFFTQSLDGRYPDAANLLLPTLGLLDARDPRFVSTVEAYRKDLMDRGLVLRYRNDDDFGETTSAFTICSFWMAEALALMGRIDEAVELFNHVLSFQNPVGLFSEDIDPETGRLLGNFPQAYTHVGLIHAAMTIGELLDVRDGRVRAWV
jgi:GH15 family glucan-1,4-alpha-glucosidase